MLGVDPRIGAAASSLSQESAIGSTAEELADSALVAFKLLVKRCIVRDP
jgi:hypothetical protein